MRRTLFVLCVCVCSSILAAAQNQKIALKYYRNLPITFEPNLGQADSRAKFIARGPGYALFLTKSGAVIAVRGHGHHLLKSGRAAVHVSQIDIVGANLKKMTIQGSRKLPGKANYFVGSNPSKWRVGVPTYAQVAYRNVYPGADLIFHGNGRQIEFDFRLAPGANASAMRLRFEGPINLDAHGNLLIGIGRSAITLLRPRAYQLRSGVKSSMHPAVPVSFVRFGAHEIGFRVGAYDPSDTLVIDPALVYSTYLGGSADDQVNAIAVDSSGAVYVTGQTLSTNFPIATSTPLQSTCGACTTADGWNAFIAKIDMTQSGPASLVYSTYLGGTNQDIANGIAVDSSGNAYVAGVTYSSDFPVTQTSAFQATYPGAGAAFLSEVSPDGSQLMYSTFYGYIAPATNPPGPCLTQASAIALQAPNLPVIVGSTCAAGLSTTGAIQPAPPPSSAGTAAFVSLFNTGATGPSSLVYSTYLGGSAGSTEANAVAVDSQGHALVAGDTNAANFPTTTGAFSTSCGTDGTCDAGTSGSGYADAFLAKLSLNPAPPSGTSDLLYSTFLGGGNSDSAKAVAVDSAGNAYVAGVTRSPDFPTTVGAFQFLDPASAGVQTGFVAKLNPAGNGTKDLIYSTYLGGTGFGEATAIAVNSAGEAYVAGETNSPDFPMASPVESVCLDCPGYVHGFAARLNAAGSALIFSTYLEGSLSDSAAGIALDTTGNVYVGGVTSSTDFPVTTGAYQLTNAGGTDGFALEISATSLPVATLTPPSLSFPDQAFGTTSSTQNMTLTSNGDAALILTSNPSDPESVTTTGDFAVDASTTTCTTGISLAPNATCVIGVTFTPTATGLRTGQLSVQTNAYGSPQTIVLSGTGTGPAIAFSASDISFSSQVVGTLSGADTVTVTNTGNANLTFAAGAVTISGANAGDFAIASDGCSGQSVAPNSTCAVGVTFKPSIGGSESAQLDFADNAGNSPQTVSVTGTGADFEAGVASTSSPSAAISPGQAASYTLIYTPEGGLTGTLSLACTGAPSEAACTVNPSSLTLNGAGAATATVTVTTTAPSSLPPIPPTGRDPWPLIILGLLGVAATIYFRCFARAEPGRLARRAGLTAILLGAALMASCGGSSKPSNPGTPAGTYDLTINATLAAGSATLQHSIALKVTVN